MSKADHVTKKSPLLILVREPPCWTSGWNQTNHDIFWCSVKHANTRIQTLKYSIWHSVTKTKHVEYLWKDNFTCTRSILLQIFILRVHLTMTKLPNKPKSQCKPVTQDQQFSIEKWGCGGAGGWVGVLYAVFSYREEKDWKSAALLLRWHFA